MKIIRQHNLGQRQQGISLLIALIFLLVITVLAIANMREVSLESRITGNMIEQKQLLNVAEASVRDGERRVLQRMSPQEPSADCEGIAPGKLCLLNKAPDYSIDASNVQVYSPDDETELYGAAVWYAQPAPGGEAQGESENPEYGNTGRAIGVFRYEINGVANNNGLGTAVRTTVALNSKGRIESE